MSGFHQYEIKLFSSLTSVDISQLVDLTCGGDFEERIEEPGLSSRYSAPQLTLSGYDDASLATIQFLSTILPGNFVAETEYQVQIRRPLESFVTMTFSIIPESVRINRQRRSWAFSCVGHYAWLSKVDASNLFRRSTTGWTTSGNQSLANTLTVFKNVNDCDILQGDTVTIGKTGGFAGETAVVASVAPDTTTIHQWILTFTEPLKDLWYTGTRVDVLSEPMRNVPLQTVVDGLLTAASLPTTGANYNVDLFASPNNPFRSAIAQGASVPNVKLGLAPLGNALLAGTATGSYLNTAPPADSWFLQRPTATRAPVDPTNWVSFVPGNTSPELYGDRISEIGPILPTAEFDSAVWAYIQVSPGVFDRVTLLTVFTPGAGGVAPHTWVQAVIRERSTNNGVTWGAGSTPYSTSGTTSTYLAPYLNQNFQSLFAPNPFPSPLPGLISGGPTAQCFGVSIIEFFACFIQIFNTGGAGSEVDFRLAAVDIYQATAAVATTIYSPMRGAVVGVANGTAGQGASLYVFFLDQLNGNTSKFYRFDVSTIFGFNATLVGGYPRPWSIFFRPETLKRNRGGGPQVFNALSYDSGSVLGSTGLLFHTFLDAELSIGPDPIQLATTGQLFQQIASAGTAAGGGIDLAVIPDATLAQNGGVLWPCAILSPYGGMIWISQRWSGFLDEVDLAGMSCGDALAQLATIVNAVYYPYPSIPTAIQFATVFRTRTFTSGQSLGALDDAESVGDAIEVSPASTVVYQYVKVTSDKNEGIVGESGDPSYQGTENALDVSNRFISSEALAGAVALYLYVYWSRKKNTISIPHPEDPQPGGRYFGLGKVFTANSAVNGVTFQAIALGHNLFSPIVKIEGIEL